MKKLLLNLGGAAIQRYRPVLFPLLVAAGFLPANAFAQSSNTLALTPSVIAGGGGKSAGGGFELSGTVGQPAAGNLQGAGYSLAGGFWGGVVVIQSAGAPRLSLALNGTNIVIFWPSDSAAFALEVTGSLSVPNWLPASPSPQDDGTNKTVTILPSAAMSFFRLKKP
jgi:hypothetical protein